jgi:hypothetical protein
MNNIIEQLNSKIGGELVKSERTVSSLTKQQKFINSINKEIEILTNRTDLILKKITKKDLKNKTESLVNEVRFWKKHSNPKLVFLTLKFKGKILLNNGESPLYYEVDNNNKSVIKKLNELKSFFQNLDSDNEFFNNKVFDNPKKK